MSQVYKNGKWECGGVYRVRNKNADEEFALCVGVINHQGHSTATFWRTKERPETVSTDDVDRDKYRLVAAPPPEAFVAPEVAPEVVEPEAPKPRVPMSTFMPAKLTGKVVEPEPVVEEPEEEPAPEPAKRGRRKTFQFQR